MYKDQDNLQEGEFAEIPGVAFQFKNTRCLHFAREKHATKSESYVRVGQRFKASRAVRWPRKHNQTVTIPYRGTSSAPRAIIISGFVVGGHYETLCVARSKTPTRDFHDNSTAVFFFSPLFSLSAH